MKFYLSSRWARQQELRKVRDRLVAAGHQVTSRWLDVDDRLGIGREEGALIDVEDVMACDVFVAFSEDLSKGVPDGAARGGRHVEWGLAAGAGKQLVVVGPRENIFHWLPGVRVLESVETLFYLS